MSLASIKQKETKGKKNALPKLRTVLALPYKQHSFVVPEKDSANLRDIFETALKDGKCIRKTFATTVGIHLGLESCLRAINANKFMAVFVSLSLRPCHLIRLITTSAETINPQAYIFAQPKLEELTEAVFGIRTQLMVIPPGIGAELPQLEAWLKKTYPAKKAPKVTQMKAKQKVPTPEKPAKKLEEVKRQVKSIPTPATPKDWSGDYISCSSDVNTISLNSVDEKADALNLNKALSNLAMKAGSKPKGDSATETTLKTPKTASEKMDIDEAESADDAPEDEFLPLHIYRPLTVNLVLPNPNKKPKKKRTNKRKPAAGAKQK